jgi:hypothetical protein
VSGVEVADPARFERWRSGWVPVDRRFLGLDRRSLVPAGLVAVLFVVAVWLLPALDDAVTVDDPIRAGDVVQVANVEFTPVVGGDLRTGLRQGQAGAGGSYPGTAVVAYDGGQFEVIADSYSGTPAQLLAQIESNNARYRNGSGFKATSQPATIANSAGDRGVAARFQGSNGQGLLAAFVFGGAGVEIVAVGAQSVDGSVPPQVTAMIQSVQPVPGGSGS